MAGPIQQVPTHRHCKKCGISTIGPHELCATCGSCPRCGAVVTGGLLCRDCNAGLHDEPPSRPAA